MIALGDITRINGAEVPTVDIITGGSPCQDLSVAGKRAGLAGERSGLFMEQIRIIKEMRDKCAGMGADDIRPRYMVWENVPGAFSSNKGEDFRCVLEETARIADKAAAIPRPEGGRWSTSGCIMGDGWSIAWRVHDAQFWGVPQRRKRISLVADFGGETAPKILFERDSVRGDFEASGEQGQGTARTAETGSDKAISFQERAGCEGGVNAYAIGNGQANQTGLHGKAEALNCMHDQQAVITYGLDRASYNQGKNARYNFSVEEERIGAQVAKGPGAVYNTVVRRLTPLECERLQGYPDRWTDIGEWTDSKGKKHKDADSPRYKALGNSIALPFWQYLADKMCAYYDRPPTMASLFDGIGGFPLVFSRAGAVPVWASEIEEFPMAVTRKHFGGRYDKQEIQARIG